MTEQHAQCKEMLEALIGEPAASYVDSGDTGAIVLRWTSPDRWLTATAISLEYPVLVTAGHQLAGQRPYVSNHVGPLGIQAAARFFKGEYDLQETLQALLDYGA